MENIKDLKAPSTLSKHYASLIGMNLGAVIHELNISQTDLVKAMEERGYHVNQGNLSRYFSGKAVGPLGLLLELVGIVHASLDHLVSEDFDAKKEATLIRTKRSGTAHSLKTLQIPLGGDAFVTDPNAPEFRGYQQTYHVYMFSPISSEERNLVSGRMTLFPEGAVFKSELVFDDAASPDATPVKFTGQVIISKPLSMAYVFLSNADTGEIHVLSFRHFKYNARQKRFLNSRVALMLTNGIGEYNSPSVYRMILSREKIIQEHHPLIMPHLYLNGGAITVPAHSLAQLSMVSEQYKMVADSMCKFGFNDTYYWNEDLVHAIAHTHLREEEVPVFISKTRAFSNKIIQNKASRKADQVLRDLLLSLGYYQK